MIWTSKQIQEALSVKIKTDSNFGKIQFNSQNIEKGDLFIALKGKKDGHEFAKDALKRGASAVIISKDIDGIDSSNIIKVSDTHDALKKLAKYKRKNSKAKFIALTGSVGKTSSKEALKLMLSSYGETHSNEGSYNNFLGCPLTLASMPDDTQYAIIELGMNAPGEIRELVDFVNPDIAIVLNVWESHIGFFKSIEDIADAKCEIFEGLDKNKGIALINNNISTYQKCRENLNNLGIKNIQTFGKNKDSDTIFSSYELLDNEKARLVYMIAGEEFEVIAPPIQIHLADNFTACFAAINALGLDLEIAVNSISNFEPLLGRGKIVSASKNNLNYKIICDYYNNQPRSMQASLEHFSSLDGKKIAILSGMGEIDGHEDEIYERILPYIQNLKASKIFLVGNLIKRLEGELSKSESFVRYYENADELVKEIDQYIVGNELILIKGSRFLKLEKIAEYLGVENAL